MQSETTQRRARCGSASWRRYCRMPTVLPTDYERARRHLMRRDPSSPPSSSRSARASCQTSLHWPPFMALAEAIASQQLSVKAADTIFGRFCDLFRRTACPIRCGCWHRWRMSCARPASAARKCCSSAISPRTSSKTAADLDRLHEKTTAGDGAADGGEGHRGVDGGDFPDVPPERPDVFPADDLGLVKAAQRVYGLRQRPAREAVAEDGGSVAAVSIGRRLVSVAERWRWPFPTKNEQRRTKN